MQIFKLADLEAISNAPKLDEKSWFLDAEGSIDFLQQNAKNDDIIIYASTKCVLIHGVLALKRRLTDASISDLQHQNIPMPDDSWKIQQAWGGGRGHRIYFEPPLESVSKTFAGGEKLVFWRSFEGVDDVPTSIELSQKLIHSLDLHFVPDRNAYCRLDNRGDIEEVVKITQLNQDSTWDWIRIVTIRRRDLDKYMALSKSCLVLRFDFTRVRWGSFAGWGDIDLFDQNDTDLYYHGGVDGQGSYCNGVMVVRPKVTVAKLIRQWKAEDDSSKRQYATFKIFDRKNNMNVETSCAPGFRSNYFQDSNLPWDISPAFFRPDVLHRFKADPEKYTLEDRSISCRNAWYLKTYDINDAGQVHTYIGYLADLPYEEQLYWQSFNEWPKGSISKRALKTDIVGQWDLEYEPLGELKRNIREMDENPPVWWKKRGRKLADAVHYPATDSVKEWADELLALDQLIVEGFLIRPLRKLIKDAEGKCDRNWGSLRLLQEYLSCCGHDNDEAKEIVQPLQQLHAIRTDVKGHATGEKKSVAASKARSEFGTFRNHFRDVVTKCEGAMKVIRSSLDFSN